ncbi:hypothetical protein AB1Y20_005589 [Prymnesium parvum]|uniref:Uncharacterized protein n=1 Tax=Prymnesium parvum TaxID=97485 RepID=A0AB34J4R4_PRYPA
MRASLLCLLAAGGATGLRTPLGGRMAGITAASRPPPRGPALAVAPGPEFYLNVRHLAIASPALRRLCAAARSGRTALRSAAPVAAPIAVPESAIVPECAVVRHNAIAVDGIRRLCAAARRRRREAT